MLEYFNIEKRPVTVRQFSSGELVDGEWINGSALEPRTVFMIPIPITPAQLKNLPEGKYVAGDMRFYHHGSIPFPEGTIFEYKQASYVVRDITDRSDHGNFVIHLAKRLLEQNT